MRRSCLVLTLILGFAMPSGMKGQKPKTPPSEKVGATRRVAPTKPDGADVVLMHGKVWTGESRAEDRSGELRSPSAVRRSQIAATARPKFAQAVAIFAGRILDVGTDKEMLAYRGAKTEVIDAKGRLVVPGLMDSHVHFIQGGFQLLQIDLKDTRNEKDFARRIGEKAKTLEPGRWLLGGNWDEEAWPSAKLPTRALIDPVTSHNPVLLNRYDGHSVLANSLALKAAGITRETPDPPGGVIVRDAASGEPTGVLKDAATGLVEHAVPHPTEGEMEEALRAALQEAGRRGVTSVQDITVSSDSFNGSFTGEIQLLRRAELQGRLTCRMYEIVPITEWQKLADAGLSREMGSDFLKLGAVKAFADGSLGSRTAWMFEPYEDDPANRGLPMDIMDPPAKMEGMIRGADRAGVQVCVHAIGDRAISEMLDLYTRLGGDSPAAHRFRIEHAQHVRAQDFARFGKLGVIASMQPYHCIDDGRWAEKRIGHERARSSYAWRSMLKAGAPLAFGSDWPVAPLDPLLGIYAAVTRATLDGKHPGGWFPEERLSVEEALRAYTEGCAYAAFEEKQKGTIARGKLADFVVLSDDLFAISPEKIKEARVLMTIVGGKVVYRGR